MAIAGIIYQGEFYALPRDAVKLAIRQGAKPEKSCGGTLGYSQKKEGASLAMSVHPDQIPMMNAALKAHGITGVHYDPKHKKNCRITSRADRARAMKVVGPMLGLSGFHDHDGGYSDG